MLQDAFMPDERTAQDRADGGAETSIDWEDDSDVEAKASRRSNAAFGLARLGVSDIEYVNRGVNTIKALLAERSPKPDNPHHGDLVFRAGMPIKQTRAIANLLGLMSQYVPPSRGGP